MATIDSKTNVYEITRSTPGSISNLEQLIRNIVKEVLLEVINTEEFRGPRGNDGNDGANGVDGINGIDGNDGNDGLDGSNLDIGCTNVVCYDDSGKDNSWYTLISGVKAEWNNNIAAAQTQWEAYADKNKSWAVLRNLIYAKHDENTASINSQMATYVDDFKALAYHTDLLQATYNGVSSRIKEDAKVWAGDIAGNIIPYNDDPCANGKPLDTSRELVIGDIAEYPINGSARSGYKQYVGTNIVNHGCPWITTSSAGTASFGEAKSLYTDSKGRITGWEYVSGASKGNYKSEFVISADNFYIQDSSTKDNVNFKITDGVTTIGNKNVPVHLGHGITFPSNAGVGDTFLFDTDNHIYRYKGNNTWEDTVGSRGATTISYSDSVTSPSDSQLDSWFRTFTTFDDYKKGDTIIYTYDDNTDGYTKYYRRTSDNFRSWSPPYSLLVNGNMIVDGSITADKVNLSGAVENNHASLVVGDVSNSALYYGVYAYTDVYQGSAVAGRATGSNSMGVQGWSNGSGGVGVRGYASESGSIGVLGEGSNIAVKGHGTNYGGYFEGNTGNYLEGGTYGAYAYSSGGYGIYANAGAQAFRGVGYDGGHFSSNNSGGSGVASFGGSGKGIWANGDTTSYINSLTVDSGTSAFTGVHICLLPITQDIVIGKLVYEEIVHSYGNIFNAISTVEYTDSQDDKRVIGVIGLSPSNTSEEIKMLPCVERIEVDNGSLTESGEIDYSIEYQSQIDISVETMESDYHLLRVNSLGEGMIMVNSENGDIEHGDLLSSSINGCAQNQGDDVVRSITVAKAREAVVWADENDTEKLIACFYMCG